MLDYNQDRSSTQYGHPMSDKVHSNNVPSLRQKMIDEALNYHQNMNSIVFKRQARNLEAYANPSGRTDPSHAGIARCVVCNAPGCGAACQGPDVNLKRTSDVFMSDVRRSDGHALVPE